MFGFGDFKFLSALQIELKSFPSVCYLIVFLPIETVLVEDAISLRVFLLLPMPTFPRKTSDL